MGGAAARVRSCAGGQPEGDEAQEQLEAEKRDYGDVEPGVEVRRRDRDVELEHRIHAKEDQTHHMDHHVRHLLRPVVHRDR